MDTPLSDLLEEYIRSQSDHDYEGLCQLFMSSEVGVLAKGAPKEEPGRFKSTSDNPFQLGLTTHGDGRPRILAFADPSAFTQKFGQPFNAGVTGVDMCKTVIFNEKCEGILLNSAKSEVSIIISRKKVLELLREDEDTVRKSSKPWWKFW